MYITSFRELRLPGFSTETNLILYHNAHAYNHIKSSVLLLSQHRYKILCPQQIKDPCTPEKACQIILASIQLPDEQFRMGKTKV